MNHSLKTELTKVKNISTKRDEKISSQQELERKILTIKEFEKERLEYERQIGELQDVNVLLSTSPESSRSF